MAVSTHESGSVQVKYHEPLRKAAPVRIGCGRDKNSCGFLQTEAVKANGIEVVVERCILATETGWRQRETICGAGPNPQDI